MPSKSWTQARGRSYPHDPEGPTHLHELLLVADHNAYHLGQMVLLRQLLGAWRE